MRRLLRAHGPVVWLVVLAAASVALLGGTAFSVARQAGAAEIQQTFPENASVVPEGRVLVGVEGVNVGLVEGHEADDPGVVLLVDGEEVPEERLEYGAGFIAAWVDLRDGEHWARAIVPGRSKRTWSFRVDTTPPSIRVESPEDEERIGTSQARVAVRFREEAEAVMRVDGAEVAMDNHGVRAEGAVTLADGRHTMSVTATDQAGNSRTIEWEAWCDPTPPDLEIAEWPGSTWHTPESAVTVGVSDNLPDNVRARAWVDGKEVALLPSPGGESPGGRHLEAQVGPLAEGRHTLELEATDAGGHSVSRRHDFLVDSTGRFGRRLMVRGALGDDVEELQEILGRRGSYQGEPTGVFDEATAKAVTGFQEARGLDATGRVDAETLERLVGRVEIDLSERHLYLYDGDEVIRDYPVAVGQPRYPTPTGSYHVVNKAYHPTWTPPPSPWAEGLEPVPPGQGNPLGTRWIGLSAPHVGIHGTYESYSVGTAASHGCVRMYIRDVEELFELVYVGTPVEIVR